jgi:hypothetical protein
MLCNYIAMHSAKEITLIKTLSYDCHLDIKEIYFKKCPITPNNFCRSIEVNAVILIHISLKYNQQDATFFQSIYFYELLYMFQAVSPPIIRSTKLHTALGIVKPVLLQQSAVLV